MTLNLRKTCIYGAWPIDNGQYGFRLEKSLLYDEICNRFKITNYIHSDLGLRQT